MIVFIDQKFRVYEENKDEKLSHVITNLKGMRKNLEVINVVWNNRIESAYLTIELFDNNVPVTLVNLDDTPYDKLKDWWFKIVSIGINVRRSSLNVELLKALSPVVFLQIKRYGATSHPMYLKPVYGLLCGQNKDIKTHTIDVFSDVDTKGDIKKWRKAFKEGLNINMGVDLG